MENEELNNTINYWNLKITRDNDLCDIALLQIFIKMEKYFVAMFIKYATGQASSAGYTAERKLCFIDDSHLINFLQIQGGTFIDYMKILEKYTKYIFEDNKDPFSLIFSDCEFSTAYHQIQSIRNYVAHESQEAKRAYMKKCLGGTDKTFVLPKKFLLNKKSHAAKSYYTYYMEQVVDKSTVLLDPRSYF